MGDCDGWGISTLPFLPPRLYLYSLLVEHAVAVEAQEVRTMAPGVAATLQHVVHQLDVITQTMSMLESRLALSEARLEKLEGAG